MDKSSNTVIRKRFIFTGNVQGVGFRYTAKYAAKSCGVTGSVKNEYDGSVIMEAQGTSRQINKLLELIKEGTYIHIDDIECEIIPVQEKEYSFRVEY